MQTFNTLQVPSVLPELLGNLLKIPSGFVLEQVSMNALHAQEMED